MCSNLGGGGGGAKISKSQKQKITKGIETHSLSQNDRAEERYKKSIKQEKNVVDNASAYIKIGHIKSTNDDWFQVHLNSLHSLEAQYDFFKKERKRLGK